jgi:hypothetical protein
MAVTSSTASNLIIGAGDVFIDGADIGATMDSNSYAIDTEWYVPDLNGVPGELQGTRYKSSETAVMGFTMPELSAAKIVQMWPNSESAVSGTVTTIDTDDTRRVSTASYHDYILQVDGLDGVQLNFYADNALNQNGLQMELSDDGTAAIVAEVMATWDGADMTASPHRIKRITGVSS